jgi:hypothetical protein
MDMVFLVGGLVLIIGVVLSIMLKEVPLRTVSGQQARVAAENAERESAHADLSANEASDNGRENGDAASRPEITTDIIVKH